MLLADMASELDVINDRVAAIDAEVKALAKTDAYMLRLMDIPGVGPTITTAVVVAFDTGSIFGKGRDILHVSVSCLGRSRQVARPS